VITSWSSKGGDGKSVIAQDLAWQLAHIAGRKVLLIDADMSRGYLAHALGKPERKFALKRNITTLAQEYLVTGSVTPQAMQEHIHVMSHSQKTGSSNLHILFGISSPDAATLPAYSAATGAQGARFINALVNQGYGVYEFIIFDIGTAITIPVHYAAIKAAGHLLVVATPSRPSVAPTREGLRQLESHQATTRDKLRLVINRWSADALIPRDELPQYFGVPLFTTIPLVDPGLMMGLINKGVFISEAVWKKASDHAGVKPYVVGIASIAENFVPGIVDAFRKRLTVKKNEKKRGIFKRL
jgi:pilus assembly protein CpaE